jgi:mono/diheme cytochrome c family protein
VTKENQSMRGVASRDLLRAAAVLWAASSIISVSAQQAGGNAEAKKLKNPVPSTAASIAAGEKSYQKFCKHCHGETGKGDGPQAPIGSTPSNFTDNKWDHGDSAGEIFTVISEGAGKGSPMKSFKTKLTEKEMWELVNYLRTLSKGNSH